VGERIFQSGFLLGCPLSGAVSGESALNPPVLNGMETVFMATLQSVTTPLAPAAIGPYSQAVVTDGWIFVSGQIPLDPESMQIIEGDISAQTHRVLSSLRAVLETAGGGFDTVVKTTVFLSDMGDFAAMNAVYADFFGEHRPARSTVAAAGLPRGVDVEIEAIARVRS